ncbi:MAG: NUDIX domain-containing protein [Oscillospiraceae bacterium]|nr:NUDIX domain-containing protein [Oscillospiraceae bacterium]
MLGKYVRIRVTRPINSKSDRLGYRYLLNFGVVEGGRQFDQSVLGAYIMGIDRPVRSFDGRVIAVVKSGDEKNVYLVVAPKSTRFIEAQVREAIAFAHGDDAYIDCLYERSCGAVVYRIINGQVRYLLIKNKRSAHWGFPKGHMERDETPEQTAAREVFEETGIRIEIIPEFSLKSEYTIQGKVEKSVIIFMARTDDVQTVIQREEIDDYVWLNYDRAIDTLKFENDRMILRKGNQFLEKNNII